MICQEIFTTSEPPDLCLAVATVVEQLDNLRSQCRDGMSGSLT